MAPANPVGSENYATNEQRVQTGRLQFISTLDAYIRWHNDTRIKDSLGFRSPIEHRRGLGITA